MKTLKYSFILFTMLSVVVFIACKEGKPDEHNQVSGTMGESDKIENQAVSEMQSEHEELPEDIVELNAEQIKVAGIQLGKIEMRQVTGIVKASGIVSTTPQNSASVSVPLGGFVKSSGLMPGSEVKKGQSLAVIENTEFVDLQQNYLDIKNKYEFAEAEYNRHTELYKDDVYSQQNVQQTTSEYRSLKAQLKGIGQKLQVIGINPDKLTEEDISAVIKISSPISGYVKTANLSMGKYISPTDVLFEIVGTDNLLLELTLFEKDANTISIGQLVKFTINNETHEHKAKIYQVGKSINADKTYKVYATVQQPCTNILPGMYVLAHIEKTNNLVTSVPADAVVSFDNKYFILVYEKEKEEGGKPFTEYRFIEIVTGDTNDGFTQIELPKGFDIQNTKVVTKGAYKLLSAKKNAGEMTCG